MCGKHGVNDDGRRRRPRTASLMDTAAFVLVLLFISASGLQITELNVPVHVDVRGTATLVCHYNLQNATLNSVKWYKDEREFFRYIPGMSPPTKAFPLQGINLDLSPSKSYDTRVTLRPLYYNTSGTFRCEVSADAPKFETVHQESNMTVLGLPQSKPAVSGVEKAYNLGDKIEANCTSDKSWPPATVQWLINNQMPDRRQSGSYALPDEPNQWGLQASTQWLRLHADRKYFENGRIELRCRATMPTVPPVVRETSVAPHLASNEKLAQRSPAASPTVQLGLLVAASAALLRRSL
ncbi:uncharacterized protein LOC117639596 [Thrips palmi]|uniref:Uncharacterized protein LOC117639596 n=1 Tax=Thrips palmi TaxID=161013 RepID=A0A6P8YC50_THRPL|nr:uncharacterized protein LOC117639596 [Thrips palmi]